ncbi:MAG: MmgE/PrpD family protein [Pseudomonadota bacterium]|nr:MmgE/PrpD family protein [Pseudomonadota bacterium]
MSLNQKMATYLEQENFDNLPAAVIETTKKFILDILATGIAGWEAPGCGEAVETITAWGDQVNQGPATILGYGMNVPPAEAAFANSTIMHALDFDDTLDSSALHTMVSVFPAALALGETNAVSGRELLTAVVLGVDVICRLAAAITNPLSWIRTATCGSFGAAAAAGKILGLSREQLRHNFGIVYSQTAGNAQCLLDGSLVKRMQPAFASRAGVFSSLLAQKGITGASYPFTGEYGFFNLYEGGKVDIDRVVDNLGKHYGIMDLSIKPYPSCRMTHAAISAALLLNSKNEFNSADIHRVEIRVSAMVAEMVGKPFIIRDNPQVDAQFSIPYTVAVAFLRGKPKLEDFTEKMISAPDILQLSNKIKVVVDHGLEANDINQVAMTVETRDGQQFVEKQQYLPGSPDLPLTVSECQEKFHNCVSFSQRQDFRRRERDIIDLVFNLEEIADIRELTILL